MPGIPVLSASANSKDVDGRPAKTADVLILFTQGAKLAWLARFGQDRHSGTKPCRTLEGEKQ